MLPKKDVLETTFQFLAPLEEAAFTAGAMTSPAAVVVSDILVKQGDSAASPYEAMKCDYHHLYSLWREVTAERWNSLLGAVPPLSQNGNRFLCSEPWSHVAGEAVYAAGLKRDGRYFFKYQTEMEYHRERLNEIPKIEITSGKTHLNGIPGILLKASFPGLSNNQLVRKAMHLIPRHIWIEETTINIFVAETADKYTEEIASKAIQHLLGVSS